MQNILVHHRNMKVNDQSQSKLILLNVLNWTEGLITDIFLKLTNNFFNHYNLISDILKN